MNAIALLYVAAGGAFGAMLRYVSTDIIARLNTSPFPYGTMVVNIFGCLLMGMWIATATVILPARAKDLHLLIATGALGGFTTFSAFSFDLFQLAERGDYGQAALYALGSVALSLLGFVLGVWLVKLVAA